jgi:uncharacterized membrane protein
MFIRIYLFFFIYAFLGWCTEVVYAALTVGKFVNRGFLNGPLCPIYGFGIIAVVKFLMPVKNNLFLLFVGSIFITSLLELLTGFVLEKMFNHKWWDYSDKPFNIGGYICPLFSLMWGIACLIVVDKIHPMISGLVYIIPDTAAVVFLAITSIVLLVDLVATVNTIFKLNKKLKHIEELSAMIKKSSDEIGENLAAGAIILAEKKEEVEDKMYQKKEIIEEKIDYTKKLLESEIASRRQITKEVLARSEQALAELKKENKELLESSIFGQKRLLNAFPGLKSTRYKEALKALKEHVFRKQ